MSLSLDAILCRTPSSDPAALLEIIAGIPSARPAALYTLSSVLAALHLESTAARNGKKNGSGERERGSKRQRTDNGGGGNAAESGTFTAHLCVSLTAVLLSREGLYHIAQPLRNIYSGGGLIVP